MNGALSRNPSPRPKICRCREAAADKRIHERRPESSALQAQRNTALRFPTSPSDEELSAQSVSWPPCSRKLLPAKE
ncbi:hypothetical protein NDU88_007367 [Pleurodeles waltl]|uniref:Uncharacterized protein n=1 Tax=Pleurodeles waltl TaxID=8319 RepID=A0AAV7VTL7_PLEWA|nr:hypothetical protein NDU88_007367 [Pleurodeles waltl]